ncbi:MAG: SusD/RagB family nutrient-binding outer membrane lipoprotein [Lutibacter sp.]|jgi:hypothetical protein
MMKKIILKVIIVGVSTLLAFSCTDDFTELNTNPNNPDSAPLTNVFAGTIINLGDSFGTSEIAYPASFVGFATRSIYNDATNYGGTPPEVFWSNLMSTFSRNNNVVIVNAEKENNFNTLGAALVDKAYVSQMLVDTYGPIPYFEADQGSTGNFKPKYDSEKDIYADLIIQLDRANDLFDNSASAAKIGVGDILLANNMDLWRKFGNSLQLRIAIRISNKDAATSKTIIKKILDNPSKYPILESNADNILLAYPGGDWREPWTSASDYYVDIKIGAPIVDILKSLSDPRLSHYAAPNASGDYIGLTVGADGNDTYSKINPQFVSNETGSVPFLKYSEVEFIKSEAYARDLATGNAATAYANGITASMMEYGIAQSDIDAYLVQANVVWNNDLERLYTQKWISLFRESWEAWSEMRRTDVPLLNPAVNSNYTGHNRTPFRFSYPDTERSLNGSNIPATVTETDNFWGYKIWWDTRSNVQ